MSQIQFDIDGYIGAGAYSKQMVRNLMRDAAKKDVLANISSLGGDIDHGLAIHDQFVDHGNVSVRLSGFVASAATVLAMGAKKGGIRMNSTAFFLIHKVSGWVDEWGYMNEDELNDLIDRLSQSAEENQKIDLVIAQIYAARTGKALADIADLMKRSTWLTAQEALEWGFIDEVVEMSSKDNFITAAKVAMLEANGLPMPTRKNNGENGADGVDASAHVIADSVVDRISKLFNLNKNKNAMDVTKFPALMACLGIDSMESDADGAHLNADYFQKINDALSRQDALETERQNAVAAQEAAEQERQNLLNRIDAIHADVAAAEGVEAKVQVIVDRIARQPGTGATRTNGGDHSGDNTDGVDWDAINALQHNREADTIL